MNQWQQQFAQQMQALCSQSTQWFERFAREALDPAFESMSSFLAQWRFDISSPKAQADRWTFRFGLTENGYVLVWFKMDGFDTLECEYEYSLPGIGRVSGAKIQGSLREADQEWAESCFQAAMDAFVSKFVDLGRHKTELVMA